MPYFLDGNNLIGLARGIARPDAEDRAALVRELSNRLRKTRARAVLFFDGPNTAGASSFGNLSIRESGGRSADEVILAKIRESRAPGEIVVVTADRDLGVRAKHAGAKVRSPAEFWRLFGTGSRPNRSAEPAVDVADWLDYFADDSNRER